LPDLIVVVEVEVVVHARHEAPLILARLDANHVEPVAHVYVSKLHSANLYSSLGKPTADTTGVYKGRPRFHPRESGVKAEHENRGRRGDG